MPNINDLTVFNRAKEIIIENNFTQYQIDSVIGLIYIILNLEDTGKSYIISDIDVKELEFGIEILDVIDKGNYDSNYLLYFKDIYKRQKDELKNNLNVSTNKVGKSFLDHLQKLSLSYIISFRIKGEFVISSRVSLDLDDFPKIPYSVNRFDYNGDNNENLYLFLNNILEHYKESFLDVEFDMRFIPEDLNFIKGDIIKELNFFHTNVDVEPKIYEMNYLVLEIKDSRCDFTFRRSFCLNSELIGLYLFILKYRGQGNDIAILNFLY